jgi:RimJ/RimL family protein N-acetyltransferase
MPLELSTERLLLRELQPQDAPALFAVFSDPVTVDYTEWEPFRTVSEAEWLVNWARTSAEQDPRLVFAWGICQHNAQDTGVIGMVTLSIRNRSIGEASLGYILLRSTWGRGFASEAGIAVVDFGFQQLQLHRITGACSPENVASARVLEKIGMRREGCLIRNKWEKEQWRDTAIFALLEDEWDTSQSKRKVAP